MKLFVLYPLIPWIGVMAAGYALGPVLQLEPNGAAAAACSRSALRSRSASSCCAPSNLYGDPAPWTAQDDLLATVLSFLNCEKYPPSLLYLLMTLGPALMLLAAFEQARGALAGLDHDLRTVPFFYYVVAYLSDPRARRLLARATFGHDRRRWPANARRLSGSAWPASIAVWLAGAGRLLYPLCRWFAGLKQRGTGWWWSYL